MTTLTYCEHRWHKVVHVDAKRCYQCGVTMSALDVIAYWKRYGVTDDRAALTFGWPRMTRVGREPVFRTVVI